MGTDKYNAFLIMTYTNAASMKFEDIINTLMFEMQQCCSAFSASISAAIVLIYLLSASG